MDTSETYILNPRDVYDVINLKGWDEAEQTHYFGLCYPDHSDCPYHLCGIKSAPHKTKVFTEYDKIPPGIIVSVSEEEGRKWYRDRKTIPLTISHIEKGFCGINYVHYFFDFAEDDKEYWELTTPGYLRDRNTSYHQAKWDGKEWVKA